MTIALIDDDVTTNFINRRKLTNQIEDCEVLPFFNGKEALDYLISGEKVNVALLDMNMPIMNGLEFIKAHSELPEENKIEKIFLFAEDGVDEDFFLKHGLHQVLRKPLTLEIIELITSD